MRFLDYQKVRQVEHEKAEAVFGTAEEPTELATKVRKFLPLVDQSGRKTDIGYTDHGHQVINVQCRHV